MYNFFYYTISPFFAYYLQSVKFYPASLRRQSFSSLLFSLSYSLISIKGPVKDIFLIPKSCIILHSIIFLNSELVTVAAIQMANMSYMRPQGMFQDDGHWVM